MKAHERKAIEAFFAQVDENGVANREKARTLHRVIQRLDSTPKDRSFEDAGTAGAENAQDLPVGVVERDGKLVGLGIDILNEDVYPLQSFIIYLRDCDLVGRLDLSGCEDMVFIDLYRNRISAVELADMPAMRILGLQGNEISEVDVSSMPHCLGIDIGMNRLRSIDVSNNPELVELYVNDNQLSELDVSRNANLKYLRCQNNGIASLDTTRNPLLRHLYATGNPMRAIKALAPGEQSQGPLELRAAEGGCVGLSFNPIYNAQWKETGEWEQSYHAYPEEGYSFEGWFDATGHLVNASADWMDEYGTSRVIEARFSRGGNK